LHTLSEEVGLGLFSTLLPPAMAPKQPQKPSFSHQDEMLSPAVQGTIRQ